MQKVKRIRKSRKTGRRSGKDEERQQGGEPLVCILKSLLLSYITTAGCLLLLALLLYRFRLREEIVTAGITAIYVLVTFGGGWMAGRLAGNRRFLWGLLSGCSYFVILAVVSAAAQSGMGDLPSNFFVVLILCAGSGMLGGMVS